MAHGSEALELGLLSWTIGYRKWKASPSLGRGRTRGSDDGALGGTRAKTATTMGKQFVPKLLLNPSLGHYLKLRAATTRS